MRGGEWRGIKLRIAPTGRQVPNSPERLVRYAFDYSTVGPSSLRHEGETIINRTQNVQWRTMSNVQNPTPPWLAASD
jgi:hypothetical protein